MKNTILAFASSLFISSSALASSATFPEGTIVIVGEIGRGTLSVPQRILEASAEGTKPVHLFINSPGGSVVLGNMIVQALNTARAKGSLLVCGTGVLAASMGFSILAACDIRYALPNARLLFHPPRINAGGGTVVTPKEASFLADDLSRTDKEVREYLLSRLPKVSTDFFDFHYTKETLWQASSFNVEIPGFIKLVDDMPGIKASDLLTFLNRTEGMFGFESPSTEYIIRRIEGGN